MACVVVATGAGEGLAFSEIKGLARVEKMCRTSRSPQLGTPM
ncbi:hypothetical protein KEM60_02982 [Austwickia sp. TVS 96-490-7B]|nr:hypothetical protein [Austwickia sp. TVS 96-490-7B]